MLSNKIILHWHAHSDSYVFGRHSVFSIAAFILLMQIICFNAPEFTKTLNISVTEAKSISANLFTAYISTLGVVLAISAIILAIVQISNNKLTTTKLIFTRTMFMPLVYFGLINIVYLGSLQILHRPNENVFFSEFYIQSIIASLYVFFFFIVLAFIVFFKTFRYLNFNNIIDDYLADVLKKVRLNYDNDYLSTRGSEVNSEILKTIEMENNVMLAKLLQTINSVSESNPNTTFLFSLNNRMAEWHSKAFNEKKNNIWSTLVSSWRTLRASIVTSENDNVRFYYSKLPSTVIGLVNKNKEEAAFYYALHLKELMIYSTLPSSDDKLYKANYKQALFYLRDLVELINTLIDSSDVASLKKAYNQFTQIIEDFDSRYRIVSSVVDPEDGTVEELKIFLFKANNAALSLFSYYIYRVQFYPNKLEYNQKIYDILSKVFYNRNHFLPLDKIAEPTQNDATDWHNWVWELEDREDGKAYILDSEENIISFGLLHLYMKYGHLKPSMTNHYLTERFDWLKGNRAELLKSMPEADEEYLDQRILAFEDILNLLQHQNEEQRKERIAAAPRSEEKIQQFRTLMSNQWKDSRNLYEIFNYFNAVEVNPQENLLQIGTPRINLNEGRVLFVDGDEYRPIYGIDWGKEVNKGAERAFVNAIVDSDIPVTKVTQITDAFSIVIDGVSYEKKKNLVAFLPSDKMYKWQVDLINSGKYQPIDGTNNAYPFQLLGIYDDKILIVRLSKTNTNKQIIILNLPEAIHYQQRQNDNFIDRKLEVSIILTDDVVDQNNENESINTQIAPANAIITVQEIMNFKVLKKESIFLFEVTDS